MAFLRVRKTRLGIESLEKRRLLSADGIAPDAAPEAVVAQAIQGDIDQDGTVGFSDFLRLSANFGETDATADMGDIDNDQQVGFSDFLILSNNYGQSTNVEAPPVDPEVDTETGDSEGLGLIEVLVNEQNQIVITSSEEISEIAYAVNGLITKIEVDATEYTLDVLGVTDLWVKSGVDASGKDIWEHFVCPHGCRPW